MEQAREFLTQFSGPGGYGIFYLIIMSCGIGFPFNSDLMLITASVLASMGYFDLRALMILAFFALLSGDTINFFVARRYGKTLLSKAPFRWILKPEKIVTAESFMRTRGDKFLFVVRFLPLIRTALFFTAGCLQVTPRKFYFLNGTATAIYLPILMGTAFTAAENIDQVIATLKKFQFGLLAGLIVIAILLYFARRKPKGTLVA